MQLSFVENAFVDNGTVNIRLMLDDSLFEAIDLTTGQVTGSGTSVVTIKPAGTLANDTEYYVEFPGGKIIGMITAKQLGSVQDRYMWHFKTARAAPEEFNPRHLDGLELWLDASDAATITSSGTQVTNWTDKSGNERDAYQTVAARRPLVDTIDLYGQKVLYSIDTFMDLSNDFLK